MSSPIIRKADAEVSLQSNVFVGVKKSEGKDQAGHNFVIYNNKCGEGLFVKAADKANKLIDHLKSQGENVKLNLGKDDGLSSENPAHIVNAFYEGVKATLVAAKEKISTDDMDKALGIAAKIAENTLKEHIGTSNQNNSQPTGVKWDSEARDELLNTLESQAITPRTTLAKLEAEHQNIEGQLNSTLRKLDSDLGTQTGWTTLAKSNDKEAILDRLNTLEKNLKAQATANSSDKDAKQIATKALKDTQDFKAKIEKGDDAGPETAAFFARTIKPSKVALASKIQSSESTDRLKERQKELNSHIPQERSKLHAAEKKFGEAKELNTSLNNLYRERDQLAGLKIQLQGQNNLIKALDLDNREQLNKINIANIENELHATLDTLKIKPAMTNISDLDTISSSEMSEDEDLSTIDTGDEKLDDLAAHISLSCGAANANALVLMLSNHGAKIEKMENKGGKIEVTLDREIDAEVGGSTIKFQKNFTLTFGDAPENEDRATSLKLTSGVTVTRGKESFSKGLELNRKNDSVSLLANVGVKMVPTKNLAANLPVE